jgi:hypothetical protein
MRIESKLAVLLFLAPVTTASLAVAQDKSARNSAATAPKESKEEADARRAKGEINFDDLQFEIEKDQPFREGSLNRVVKSLNGKKVKL